MAIGISSLDVSALNAYNGMPQGIAGLTIPQSGVAVPTGSVSFSPVNGVTPGLGNTQGFSATGSGASGASSALGYASIGMAIGQAIGGMYSAWKGGKTIDYVMDKQAEIAEHNRQRGQLGAESVWRQAESQVAQITYKAGQVKAKQRVAYASNGVATDVGSAAEVTATTDIMKKLDVETTRMNALSAAWGYKNQAVAAGTQAAQFSGLSGYMQGVQTANGFGSFLEGGMLAAERWYKYFGD